MSQRYDPASFEAKWRSRWKESELFLTREDVGKPKFYGLDFFPYPSGAGLSVGHCRNYVPTDVLCRMKVMQGYNVLHPMGFDAFGLPAEDEAIKRQSHPAPMIEKYADNYRRQMDLVGISYDWSRSFRSSDPDYYRWTQWIFKELYRKGLAYRKMAAVNWDPVAQTVLADEEVVGGRAERSGALVERRFIPQWFFKITEYAQRLIDDLDTLDWPEGIKQQQRNWIGRSEGVEFTMRVDLHGERGPANVSSDIEVVRSERTMQFDVFTTRIDTVFGMSFCVLAPEHPILDHLLATVEPEHANAVRAYQTQAKSLTDTDRLALNREKTGVFTGAYALNPANGERVPIFVADYVLITYGTGAIMAVPGHDERDYEFAKRYGLKIPQVIGPADGRTVELPWTDKEEAVLVNSGEYTGMSVKDAQRSLGEWIEALGIGHRKIQYRLRDWLISRQRYWGCPIPIMYSHDGEEQLVPDDALPVTLPDVDSYAPSGDGKSPLAKIPEFVNCTDLDGRLGQRETDTMGGFACSSWYFLRFCDPFNDEQPWSKERVEYWMPVDCYVGGAEHAVMHLLYARFWTKVLFDAGLVPVSEPFARLQNQGQVLNLTPYRQPQEHETLKVGEEGIQISYDEAKQLPDNQVAWRWARMSKSKGNVVTPDEMVERYGADALRVYLLFVAPFDQDVQWSNEGMSGAVRFLNRVFKMASDLAPHYRNDWRASLRDMQVEGIAKDLRRATHQTIRKATDDIDGFRFNTYIAAMMTFLNAIGDFQKASTGRSLTDAEAYSASEALETFILLLAPTAPHSADELWEFLSWDGFTYDQDWPKSIASLAAEVELTIAIQVNGKLRDTITLAAGSSKEALETAAFASSKVQAHLEGKSVRKVIVVPEKLVNIVVQ